MEIKGKIIQILDPQSGTSVRGEWKKQDFIIETLEQYPKKICISNWNDKIPASTLQTGKTLNFGVNIESREFNGKWYTEIKAWKVDEDQAQQQTSSETTASDFAEAPWDSEPPAESENSDDLPF